jgi:hypothetical protein
VSYGFRARPRAETRARSHGVGARNGSRVPARCRT